MLEQKPRKFRPCRAETEQVRLPGPPGPDRRSEDATRWLVRNYGRGHLIRKRSRSKSSRAHPDCQRGLVDTTRHSIVKTYRYLRIAMVLLVLLLAASVLREAAAVGF